MKQPLNQDGAQSSHGVGEAGTGFRQPVVRATRRMCQSPLLGAALQFDAHRNIKFAFWKPTSRLRCHIAVCGHTACSVLWGLGCSAYLHCFYFPFFPLNRGLMPDSKLLAFLCLHLSTCQIAHRIFSALSLGLQVTVHWYSCILCVSNLVCCAGSFSAMFESCGSLGASHTGSISLRGFFNYIDGVLLSCVRSGWEKHCDFLFQMQMKLGKYDSPTAILLVLVPLLEHSCAQQLVWNQRTRKFAQLADINRESVTMRDA